MAQPSTGEAFWGVLLNNNGGSFTQLAQEVTKKKINHTLYSLSLYIVYKDESKLLYQQQTGKPRMCSSLTCGITALLNRLKQTHMTITVEGESIGPILLSGGTGPGDIDL
ncbi:hypothetical protein WN943_028959 [Citrus x changshan-huyou]